MGAMLVIATGLLAAPAWASQLKEVRVGNHPTYTRVVFELDSPTGYRIERRSQGGVSEILVTIDAGSTPRSVNRQTVMVERVAVQDGRDRSVAHIRLKQQPSRVKEMILADPPRLVFDLVFPESKLAAIRARDAAKAAEKAKASETAEPTQIAQAGQAADQTKAREAARKADEAKARETARKADEAKARETARKAEEAKARESARKADEAKAREVARKADEAKARKEAREIEEAKAREVARKAEEAKTREEGRKVAEAKAQAEAREIEEAKARQADAAKAQAMARKAEADEAKAQAMARQAETDRAAEQAMARAADEAPAEQADVDGSEQEGDLQAAEQPGTEPQIAEQRKPRPVREMPSAEPRSKPRRGSPDATPSGDSLLSGIDWGVVGAAGAGVLMVVILFVLWLRRRSLPNDMDVTALAENAEADDAAGEGFTWGEDASEVGSPASTLSDSSNLPVRSATQDRDISAGPGSDDEHEKENAMDSETPNLPMDRTASEMPTTVGVAGGDVGRLLSEVERRVAQLETRLDESVDARERLERQVAAQAEELRVQRAAIARTQRALRSLNRGEEEQATEPAIREPSS
jgi:hypothetical protein